MADDDVIPSLGDLFAAGAIRPIPLSPMSDVPPGVHSLGMIPPFASKLAGTKVVDPQGNPLLVFRGEHGVPPARGGFQSRLPSLSFGSREAANTYAMDPNDYRETPQAPRVTPSFLSIRNPIIHNEDDPFVDFSDLLTKLGPRTVRAMAREHGSHIENTNNWDENFSNDYVGVGELLARSPNRLGELYMDAYPLLDDPRFVNAARRRGFDGAIHIGSGETATDLEYRIFHPSQAISPWELYR